MDNVTHSLLGAALAAIALPATADAPRQRLFFAAGLFASNAPDLDLLYVGITPSPLGYLLHHRGHTHTIAGLIAQCAIFGLICQLTPAGRRLAPGARARLWLLIAVSLIAHVLLDACNTYGVHPFFPFDARWIYGDTLFIIEPWLWLLLGLSAALNARTAPRRYALFALIALPCAAFAALGLVPIGAAALLAIAGAGCAYAAREWPARRRASAAVAASALFIIGMFGLSRVAGAEARARIAPDARGTLLDVALSPNPAAPLCWSVITVEQDEAAGELTTRRGTLSLRARWQDPANCPSHRMTATGAAAIPARAGTPRAADDANAPARAEPGQVPGREAALLAGRGAAEQRGSVLASAVGVHGVDGDASLIWIDEIRQPIAPLRARLRDDCWAAAWLQFGRVPLVRDGEMVDLRFENDARANFTAMPLASGRTRAMTGPAASGSERGASDSGAGGAGGADAAASNRATGDRGTNGGDSGRGDGGGGGGSGGGGRSSGSAGTETVAHVAPCPAHVTSWRLPRADLLLGATR